jgi:alpha-L-rhamnosidase
MGIPPDRTTETAVRNRLIDITHIKYNTHLAVGLVGIPIFAQWAIDERQTELMADLLRQPDYPGYLHMIANGATTTWESWNGDRSHVHNCYNGIGIWFYQALAGIRPDPEAPGYKHFFVDPQPLKDIQWVKASQPTPYGNIDITIEGKKITISIPVGTTATLFPDTAEQQTLPAGHHTIATPNQINTNN